MKNYQDKLIEIKEKITTEAPTRWIEHESEHIYSSIPCQDSFDPDEWQAEGILGFGKLEQVEEMISECQRKLSENHKLKKLTPIQQEIMKRLALGKFCLTL